MYKVWFPQHNYGHIYIAVDGLSYKVRGFFCLVPLTRDSHPQSDIFFESENHGGHVAIVPTHTQVCQSAHFNTSFHHNIADQGSEEMWIDSELGPFLYYTGPGNRYHV